MFIQVEQDGFCRSANTPASDTYGVSGCWRGRVGSSKLYRPLGAPGGRYSLLLPAYVCDERRWLIARPITSFRSASSVMPSKPKPK
jgi:hypothetical protein